MRRLVLLLCLWVMTPAAATAEPLWDLLRAGGLVILLRHATAPGVGDPANFKLDDCTTQRGLSDDGRAQARRIGEALRAQNVPIGRVLSSRWCRALETARLALGRVDGEPMLDQFYKPEERDERTQAVRAIIAAAPQSGTNLVLITHQPNVTALTNLSVEEGEIVVMGVAPDNTIAVYGRLKL